MADKIRSGSLGCFLASVELLHSLGLPHLQDSVLPTARRQGQGKAMQAQGPSPGLRKLHTPPSWKMWTKPRLHPPAAPSLSPGNLGGMEHAANTGISVTKQRAIARLSSLKFPEPGEQG